MGVADWLSGDLDSVNLAKKLLTANELIFAEYCEIHACCVGSVKFSPVIRGDTGLIEDG